MSVEDERGYGLDDPPADIVINWNGGYGAVQRMREALVQQQLSVKHTGNFTTDQLMSVDEISRFVTQALRPTPRISDDANDAVEMLEQTMQGWGRVFEETKEARKVAKPKEHADTTINTERLIEI